MEQFFLVCEMIGKFQFLFPLNFIGYPTAKDLEAIGKRNDYLLQYGTEYKSNNFHEKFGKFGKKYVDLLCSMVRWNPKVIYLTRSLFNLIKKRPSINEIMVHPFFYEHPRPVYPEDMRFLKHLETYSADIIHQYRLKKKVKK